MQVRESCISRLGFLYLSFQENKLYNLHCQPSGKLAAALNKYNKKTNNWRIASNFSFQTYQKFRVYCSNSNT